MRDQWVVSFGITPLFSFPLRGGSVSDSHAKRSQTIVNAHKVYPKGPFRIKWLWALGKSLELAEISNCRTREAGSNMLVGRIDPRHTQRPSLY